MWFGRKFLALAKQVSQRKIASLVKNSAQVKLKTPFPKVFFAADWARSDNTKFRGKKRGSDCFYLSCDPLSK
jgi:hypothetical protein